MAVKKSLSPLRYPGGKNKLSSYVQQLIKYNNLEKCTYIEPYTGGGAVALRLLFDGIVDNIIINDFDRSIYAFWYSVLNYTDELCSLIEKTPVTMENWFKQRDIQKEKDNVDLLTLGFSTLFLNRTNRSGIIKAGVIGGLNQTGNYKIDCRFNKDNIIEKIKSIANFKEKITLYNLDTLKLIDDVIPNIANEKFIFFDPPYYKKGSSLYVNFYKHDDHVELMNHISSLTDSYWITSYDNVPEITDLYSAFRNNVYSLSYTANIKYKGKEVMFFSDNLKLNKELLNISF